MRDLFGPPSDWPQQDLIAFSDEFDAWLAFNAYRCGVFPMPLQTGGFGEQMGWWSPMQRGVIPPEGLRMPRSLRQSAKRYTTTVDREFERVLAECANPNRPGGWIDERIKDVYTQLHAEGRVHSVETWDDSGRLVGGLYGVSVGALFAGESMFHDSEFGRDASKVALLRLVNELLAGSALLDVQWASAHLETLGALSLPRMEYLELLDEALDGPEPVWNTNRISGAELTECY